jgi:hypothetical protein
VALLTCILPACLGRSVEPRPRARAPVGDVLGAPPTVPAPPLAVTQRWPEGPQGPTDRLPRGLVVAFNQPMVALGGPDPGAPLRLEPAIPGKAWWFDDSTLKVDFTAPLKLATRYTVRIPAGTRSLAGATLREAVRFTFETRAPAAISAALWRRSFPFRRWVDTDEVRHHVMQALNQARLHQREGEAESLVLQTYRLLTGRYHPLRVEPDDDLLLRFDQAVAPQDIRKHVRLTAGGVEVPVEASLMPGDPDEYPVVRLRPARPLPRAAKVSLELRPGFRGLVGPVPATKGLTMTFGPERALTAELECNGEVLAAQGGACWPMAHAEHAGLTVRFSRPVVVRDVLPRLVLSPSIIEQGRRLAPSDWEYLNECGKAAPGLACTSELRLKRGLRPRTAYTLEIRPGAKDIFDQPLGTPARAAFTTRGLPPDLFVTGMSPGSDPDPPDAQWVLGASERIRARHVNLRTLDLRAAVLGRDTFVPYLECLGRDPDEGSGRPTQCLDRKDLGLKVERRTLDVSGPADQVREVPLRLLPAEGTRGVVAFALSSPERLDGRRRPRVTSRVINRTALNVHARLLPHSLTVWVTTLAGARPVRGAQVEVLDARGQRLHSGQTSGDGLITLPGFSALIPRGGDVPRIYVWVAHGKDAAYAVPSVRESEPDDFTRRPGEVARHPGLARDVNAPRGSWEGDGPHRVGHVGTERDVYRPGETVHVHGVVREWLSGKQRPWSGGRGTLTVADPRHTVVFREPVTLDDFGAFVAQVALPLHAHLGAYTLTVGQTDQERLASTRFQVKAFRAPSFAAALRMRAPTLLAGDTAEALVTGRHLSGSPMSGASYQYAISRKPSQGRWPDLEAYEVASCLSGAPGTAPAGVAHRGQGVLAAGGDATIQFPTSGEKHACPAEYEVEAELRDPTQSTVASRGRFLVFPADRHVGVRLLSGARNEQRVRFEVVVVDATGARQDGHPVTLRVHRLRPGAQGIAADDFDWSRAVVTRTLVVPRKGLEVSLDWPRGLPEVIASFSVADPAGRTSRTDLRVFSPVPPTPGDPRPPRSEDADSEEPLSITLDQESYVPGQTAVMTVRSRVALASAVVFVEGQRGHAALPLRLARGQTRVTFPVTAAHLGKQKVTVVAYPAGALRRRGDPVLALTGTATMEVAEERLDLRVSLRTDRPRYRPGEEVTVTFSARAPDQVPREVELVVMAVDEAALRLTGFRHASPQGDLTYAPEAWEALEEDLRWRLVGLDLDILHRAPPGTGKLRSTIRQNEIEHEDVFAIEGSSDPSQAFQRTAPGQTSLAPARQRFSTTPLFRLVRSRPDGSGQLRFRLPDDLTAFRIVAVAFDRERLAGTGETVIEVDRPVQARPALPRLVRVGDRFEGGVVITSAGQVGGTAEVQIQTTGLTLVGPATRRIPLSRSGSQAVRFTLEARSAGVARLAFRVKLGNETDVLEVRLPVQHPVVPEHRATAGVTDQAAEHAIDLPPGVDPTHGGLDLTLSSTILGGLDAGVEQLATYPYGCMEQQASRLLALVASLTLGQSHGLSVPGATAARAREAVEQLLTFQSASGGFRLWPRSAEPSPWLSAYALLVLHAADQASVRVDPRAVASVVRYLLRGEAPGEGGSAHEVRRDLPGEAALPLAAYALSLHGYAVDRDLRAIFARRAQLPLFSRILLLAAVGHQLAAVAARRPLRPFEGFWLLRPPEGARPPAPGAPPAVPPLRALADVLLRELLPHGQIAGDLARINDPRWGWDGQLMSSSDRTSALALLALLQVQPDHPLVDRLARYLAFGRRDATGRPTARFQNTQEGAFALLALRDYARLREGPSPDLAASVWLGARRIAHHGFQGRSAATVRSRVPMADLAAAALRTRPRLIFQRQGQGRLYYSARLVYAQRTASAAAVSRGFTVSRQSFVLDRAGQPATDGRPPRLGDVVLVVTTVQTPETRRFVSIDDPTPAGMEAIDSDLATSSRLVTPTFTGTTGPCEHRELRDDRVLHFADTLPAGTHRYAYHARVTSPGRFVWPAARAVEMYSPEVHGISPGQTLVTE